MANARYFYFTGIVHPPGPDEFGDDDSISDTLTKEQVDTLDLRDYAITEGHPPNLESVVKHKDYVRGRILGQYKDCDGNLCVFGKVSLYDEKGKALHARMQAGTNCSLSLGHQYQLLEDRAGNLYRRMLGDHVAIVDEPRRPGCHIHGFISADKIDNNVITSWAKQQFSKTNAPDATKTESDIPSSMETQTATPVPAATAPLSSPVPVPTAPAPSATPTMTVQQPGRTLAQTAAELDPQSMSLIEQRLANMDVNNMTKEDMAALASILIKKESLSAQQLQERDAKIAFLDARFKEQEKLAVEQTEKNLSNIIAPFQQYAEQYADADPELKKATETFKSLPGTLCKGMYGNGTDVNAMSVISEGISCAARVFARHKEATDRHISQMMQERKRMHGDDAQTVGGYVSSLKRPRMDRWNDPHDAAPTSAPSHGGLSIVDIQHTIQSYCSDGLISDVAKGVHTPYTGAFSAGAPSAPSGRFAKWK
jgi:hypothetical protein